MSRSLISSKPLPIIPCCLAPLPCSEPYACGRRLRIFLLFNNPSARPRRRHRSAMRNTVRQRRGASVLEFAIVAPVTFMLILGLIIGGLGVFRYQEVAQLAREG